MFNNLKQKARPYIPFTSLNTVWRHIDSSNKTLLDVGCGKGEPAKFINRKGRYFAVGLDAFEPYLRQCRKDRIHSAYVQGDVRHLPFADHSFDLVICLEVLEHLEKEDGEKLLEELERVAKRQVILSTPVGFCEQDAILLEDKNILQMHKSGWLPNALTSEGFKIRGSTIRCLGGRAGTIASPSAFLRPLAYLLWLLSSPVVYFFPRLAADMVCTKMLAQNVTEDDGDR